MGNGRQCAYRAEIPLGPLPTLAIQLLVFELGRTFLACLLVLLALGLLAVHAAVLDEAAGRAVLELDSIAGLLAAVGAGFHCLNFARHSRFHGSHCCTRGVAGGRPAQRPTGMGVMGACFAVVVWTVRRLHL